MLPIILHTFAPSKATFGPLGKTMVHTSTPAQRLSGIANAAGSKVAAIAPPRKHLYNSILAYATKAQGLHRKGAINARHIPAPRE